MGHEVQEKHIFIVDEWFPRLKESGARIYGLRILHPLVIGFLMLEILFNYWSSQEQDSCQTERNTSSVELYSGSFALSVLRHMHKKHNNRQQLLNSKASIYNLQNVWQRTWYVFSVFLWSSSVHVHILKTGQRNLSTYLNQSVCSLVEMMWSTLIWIQH